MIHYLKNLLSKELIYYDGFNCGCCGKWWNISFTVLKRKSQGEQWDTWGLCPKGKGCNQ